MKKLCFLPIVMFSIGFLSFGQKINCNLDSNARVRITSNNISNKYTCFMEMTRGNSFRFGTGFLIHPRVILSAGHNFAWFPSGKVSQVKVYFGSIDNTNFLESDTLNLEKNTNLFYKKSYWIRHQISRDYSIVILPDSSIYKKVGGCFKIVNPADFASLKEINITGSPGDKDLFEIWTSQTTNFTISPNLTAIFYDLFAVVRNSGSPIWTNINNEVYALGVHSRGWGNCTASVLLTPEVVNEVRNWCTIAGVDFD